MLPDHRLSLCPLVLDLAGILGFVLVLSSTRTQMCPHCEPVASFRGLDLCFLHAYNIAPLTEKVKGAVVKEMSRRVEDSDMTNGNL